MGTTDQSREVLTKGIHAIEHILEDTGVDTEFHNWELGREFTYTACISHIEKRNHDHVVHVFCLNVEPNVEFTTFIPISIYMWIA